jgi:hypothetical protein
MSGELKHKPVSVEKLIVLSLQSAVGRSIRQRSLQMVAPGGGVTGRGATIVVTIKEREVFEGLFSEGNRESCKAKIWSHRTGDS